MERYEQRWMMREINIWSQDSEKVWTKVASSPFFRFFLKIRIHHVSTAHSLHLTVHSLDATLFLVESKKFRLEKYGLKFGIDDQRFFENIFPAFLCHPRGSRRNISKYVTRCNGLDVFSIDLSIDTHWKKRKWPKEIFNETTFTSTAWINR